MPDFPGLSSPLPQNTTPYKRASPAVPPTRVVGLGLKKKKNPRRAQYARQHSRGERNRAIHSRQRKTPATEPRAARAKPQKWSSNHNGRKGPNRDARCRDRPIRAQEPTAQGGRDLDSSSLPYPRSTRGRLLPYKVLFFRGACWRSRVPTGAGAVPLGQWPTQSPRGQKPTVRRLRL